MKKILAILRTGKFWKELVIMTLGMLVGGAAVYYFLLPSKLVIGSISGLSIVISALLEAAGINIKVSLIVSLINAILLVIAWFLIGKEFGAKTVYTAIILGPCMEFWEMVMPYEKLLQPGQVSVMAILFNINASTGGLDILAKIVNKFLHFDIGTSVTVAGAVICLTAFSVNPPKLVIIGLIGTWLNGLVVDYFTASLNKRKRVCIISDQHERIREYIVTKLKRGCSLYEVMGGYSGEKHMEVQTLLTQNEFASLMAFIKEENINSFITSGNVSEVYGLWRGRQ